MSRTIAVVLFNLGGPSSRAAIRPFLINFFMDPNIIRAPRPVRWLLARYIAWKRYFGAAGDSYARLGNRSPLLENTRAQATALSVRLNRDPALRYSVHVCMRYWHPMSDEVARKIKDEGPDHIVLLPLYPQYSTTTTWSAYEAWRAMQRAYDIDVPTSFVCCYPTQGGFVAAAAALVREAWEDMAERAAREGMLRPRVLFSAHGLPEDIIADGDPYQWQCERSAAAIAAATGIDALDWQICYQSRVGPKKWIGPSTEEALREAGRARVPVVVFAHAFVSEHVETLVEIEEEYREKAKEAGVPAFARVPTVSLHKAFIDGLASMVEARAGIPGVGSQSQQRLCPAGFCRCAMGLGLNIEGARSVSEAAPQTVI